MMHYMHVTCVYCITYINSHDDDSKEGVKKVIEIVRACISGNRRYCRRCIILKNIFLLMKSVMRQDKRYLLSIYTQ